VGGAVMLAAVVVFAVFRPPSTPSTPAPQPKGVEVSVDQLVGRWLRPDGGRPGAGRTGTITVNGQQVAQGRIEKTQPNVFSADETADVGVDDASPVVEEYGEGRKSWFTGRINRVTVEVK